MKTLKTYLLIAIALIGGLGLSSCESEEDLGEKLVNGYCWEGYIPVYDWNRNDYYSRFFFDGGDMSGYGSEEVYRNGRYQRSYEFNWYWKNNSFAVLVLDYGRRWEEKSCIDVIEISHGRLRGYFYEYLDDFDYEKADGFRDYADRESRYIELYVKEHSRYH